MSHVRIPKLGGQSLILTASVIWGAVFVSRKFVLPTIDPILLSFLSSLCTVVILLLAKVNYRSAWLRLWENPWAHSLQAIIGVVIGATLMFKGFALMDVGVAVTLEKTRPIFVIILAYFFLGERFSLRKSPLIILALLSVYFVAQRNPTMAGFATIELKGVLAMLTASLSFAITAILAKYLSGTSATPTEIVFIRYALATFLLFPVFLFRVELALPYSPDLFEGGIVFFGTFASTLAYVIYYCGLRCVSAGNSSFLQLTTPAVTLALGVVILGENITLSQLAGILGLATAIILIQREEKVKTPSIIPAVERAVIIKRCRA